MAAEGAIDNVTESFIINLREDSESDSESDNILVFTVTSGLLPVTTKVT